MPFGHSATWIRMTPVTSRHAYQTLCQHASQKWIYLYGKETSAKKKQLLLISPALQATKKCVFNESFSCGDYMTTEDKNAPYSRDGRTATNVFHIWIWEYILGKIKSMSKFIHVWMVSKATARPSFSRTWGADLWLADAKMWNIQRNFHRGKIIFS